MAKCKKNECCDLAGSLQFGPNYNWIFRTFIIFRERKNNFNINIDQLIHPFVMYTYRQYFPGNITWEAYMENRQCFPYTQLFVASQLFARCHK